TCLKSSSFFSIAGRLSYLRAPRPARLPNPKPTTINSKDSRYERGTTGGQVMTNGVDTSRFAPRKKDPELVFKLGLQGKFIVGYIGTHGMAHALETILDAAREIRAEADGDRFRFLFLGDGSNKAA